MCVCVCGGEGRERLAARLWQVFWLHVSCCRFDVILYLHFVNAWAVERGELWRPAIEMYRVCGTNNANRTHPSRNVLYETLVYAKRKHWIFS